MESKPIVFISYYQKFNELKDFFDDILQDLGFRTEVFDYGSTNSPIETERELIKTSDAFIGILTPDQKTEDGTCLCSHSVNAETGMAFAANKPIQLLAFDEVDFASIQFVQTNTIPKIKTLKSNIDGRLTFDVLNLRLLFKTLLEFKRQIDGIYKKKKGSIDAFFSYRTFKIEQEIVSPEEVRIHNSIDAIALKNIDTHTHAGRLLCERDTGKGIKLEKDALQFKMFKPTNGKAIVRIGENDHSTFRFYIDFEPPILAGTDLKYAYRRKHYNYFPFTLEELKELISKGKLKNRIMASNYMIGQDFFVTQPTDKLFFKMSFPKKYPINKYKALVCYAKGEQIHDSETERANGLIHLEHDEFDDIFSLEMVISNPHLNLSYYLLYVPPIKHEIRGE
ncbi:hypothetical protein GMMP13_100029 [Candidatus Magnetomoraceae bacterium gMMP-13]